MCSYCGCDKVDVIGRFMREHEQLVNVCGELRRAVEAGDAEARVATADRLAEMFAPHTHAEEVGLFAVLRDEEEEFAETIDRLCGEHTTLDDLLAQVRDGDAAVMPVLENALRRHIDHEDNGLFPAAHVAFSTGGQWERVHELTPPATA